MIEIQSILLILIMLFCPAFGCYAEDTIKIVDVNARYQQGIAEAVLGDLISANVTFEKALVEDPGYRPASVCIKIIKDVENGKIKMGTAVSIFKSLDHSNKGQGSSALEEINKAIGLDPDYAVLYNERGIIRGNEGNFVESLADFYKAVAIDINFADPYLNIAVVYLKAKRSNDSILFFTKAISLDPSFWEAYVGRANAHIYNSHFNDAIADLGKAITLNPNKFEAYINRSGVYAELGSFNEAIKDLDIAIKLKPGMPMTYVNKGIYCEKTNRIKDAIDSYERFLALATSDYSRYVEGVKKRIRTLSAVK